MANYIANLFSCEIFLGPTEDTEKTGVEIS